MLLIQLRARTYLVIDLGKGIKWTINGNTVTSNDVANIDLGVNVGRTSILVDVINIIFAYIFLPFQDSSISDIKDSDKHICPWCIHDSHLLYLQR